MNVSELCMLTKSNKWITVKLDRTNKYYNTYKHIKEILNSMQGKGDSVENGKIYEIYHDNIITKIIKIQSHRLCTVAYCIQNDINTNGVRYLVYGTKYNEDSQYGIGISLENIDVTYADKFCPNKRGLSRYLDDSLVN